MDNNAELINLLLYVPFFLVAVISGVIFCLKGYRQGLWRALISLGTTVVCLILSLLFARGLGILLSGPVSGIVPDEVYAEMGPLSGFAAKLITGLIQDVLAIVLFGLVLLILLIVLKVVGNHIKADELLPESKGMRWAGFGVRALDAIVVTLFLLLPLYGTIATYVSPVTRAAETVLKADSVEFAYLKSAAENPIVTLYKAGPTSWVQGGLSGFSVGDADVDLTDITDLLDDAVDLVDRLVNAEDEEEAVAAMTELSEYLRENLIEEEWFFSIVCGFREELTPMIDELEGYEKDLALRLVELTDLTQEEFEDNGIAALDFVSYCLKEGILDYADSGDLEDLPEGFYEEFGALLNHSEKTVEFKRFIVVGFASNLFYESPYDENAEVTDEDWDQAEEKAWQEAEAFVSRYWGDGKVTDPAQQIKEAEAFAIFFFESDDLNNLEAFARLPQFGAAAVESFLTAEFVADALYRSEMEQLLTENPEILASLKEKLYSFEIAPLTEPLFEDYAELALSAAEFAQTGEVDSLGTLSIGEISYLLSAYGEDLFAKESNGVGTELYAILSKCDGASDEVVDISALAALLHAAKEPELWPSKDAEVDSLDYYQFSSAVTRVLSSDAAMNALSALISERGNDPLGLGKNLSAGQKEYFAEYLDQLPETQTSVDGTGNSYYIEFKDGVSYEPAEGEISGSISSGNKVVVVTPAGSSGGGSISFESSGDRIYVAEDGSYSGSLAMFGSSSLINLAMSEEEAAAYKAQLEKNIPVLKEFFGI